MAQEAMVGRGGWEEAPHGLWPTHIAGWGFSQEQRWNIPMSLSPFPWTALGRKKLHQQPHSQTYRERGVRCFDTKHTAGQGGREEVGREKKADRKHDALRRSLKVALTPDSAIAWGAWSCETVLVAHLGLIAGLRLGRPL